MNIRLTEREGVREDGRRVYVWEIERERERSAEAEQVSIQGNNFS